MFRITGISQRLFFLAIKIFPTKIDDFLYYLLVVGNLHNFVSINTIFFLHNKMGKIWTESDRVAHTRKVSHKSNYDLMNIHTL